MYVYGDIYLFRSTSFIFTPRHLFLLHVIYFYSTSFGCRLSLEEFSASARKELGVTPLDIHGIHNSGNITNPNNSIGNNNNNNGRASMDGLVFRAKRPSLSKDNKDGNNDNCSIIIIIMFVVMIIIITTIFTFFLCVSFATH